MKEIKITFLGTASMVPTKSRNHTAIFMNFEPFNFLIDCGEGTQRQFKRADINPNKVNHIFITHLHGDHVLGLPGLFQTLNAYDRNQKLTIFGPEGIKRFISNVLLTFGIELQFELEIVEVKDGQVIFDTSFFLIKAVKLLHSVDSFGYRFEEKDEFTLSQKKIEKMGMKANPLLKDLKRGHSVEVDGKKILPSDVGSLKKGRILSFMLDTKLVDSCYLLAKDCDLLISEATHLEKDKDSADGYFHLTAKQAAQIALKSNVKRLILTHLSQRYRTSKDSLAEAISVFKNTFVAEDFKSFKL